MTMAQCGAPLTIPAPVRVHHSDGHGETGTTRYGTLCTLPDHKLQRVSQFQSRQLDTKPPFNAYAPASRLKRRHLDWDTYVCDLIAGARMGNSLERNLIDRSIDEGLLTSSML